MRGLDQEVSAKSESGRRFTTISGHPINEVYTHSDIAGLDPKRDLGQPGDFPYTRGVYENMYRGRLWTMRQFAGFGTAEDTNRRFKYLLEQGQTCLLYTSDAADE